MQQAKMLTPTSCGPGPTGTFAKHKSLISHIWLIGLLAVVALHGTNAERNKNCKYPPFCHANSNWRYFTLVFMHFLALFLPISPLPTHTDRPYPNVVQKCIRTDDIP